MYCWVLKVETQYFASNSKLCHFLNVYLKQSLKTQNISIKNEEVFVTNLIEIQAEKIDMTTLVIIGNENTVCKMEKCIHVEGIKKYSWVYYEK